MQKLENERILLVMKKTFPTKLLPILTIILAAGAACVKLFRSDGILLGFFPITNIKQYDMVYAGEWVLITILLATGVLTLIYLAGLMVFLTNIRIVITRSKKRYQTILPTADCIKAEKQFPTKLVLSFPARTVVLRNFTQRDDFIMELDQIKSFPQQTNPQTTAETVTAGTNIKTPEENPMEKLDSLIGLEPVKQEIIKLRNYASVMQLRRKENLPVSGLTLHTIFEGNPGTGKTSVARIMASILKENGILESGHLVETDRSGLVGEYVGQTAMKTNRVIDKAINGVLFVDEAYMLSEGGTNDYGKEAIATLLKRMEDDRERLVVILAGYSQNMERFLDSNPGLRSRFTRKIIFPDYSPAELVEIFKHFCKNNGYILEPEAEKHLLNLMMRKTVSLDVRSGNARFARNIFETAIQNQATRLAGNINNVDELKLIQKCDLPK